jgi:hypothetical protein
MSGKTRIERGAIAANRIAVRRSAALPSLSASGVHTDNAGDSWRQPTCSGGNNISSHDRRLRRMGARVQGAPRVVSNNTVSGCDVGLARAGELLPLLAQRLPVAASSDRDVLQQRCHGTSGGTGLYVTTNSFVGDVHARVTTTPSRGREPPSSLKKPGGRQPPEREPELLNKVQRTSARPRRTPPATGVGQGTGPAGQVNGPGAWTTTSAPSQPQRPASAAGGGGTVVVAASHPGSAAPIYAVPGARGQPSLEGAGEQRRLR